MFKKLIITALLFMPLLVNAESEDDAEIHQQLRQLLTGIETAVNTEHYADLNTFFHQNLRVTTVNQNTISSYADMQAYFKDWFGEDGYLVSLKMTLSPDALTELYHNKTMGIVRGDGIEKYKLSDGRDIDLKTRWTATVIKDDGGQWRILALHLGTNFYDNAIYHETKNYLTKMGIIGTVLALVLGVGLGFYLRGRKRKGTA
ncbi:MAG: hypothetical protein COA95_11645 [Methylophaga sp.]|nr:MAG: hypothetical protein COA95_11645 [Methylophaga sp.]